MNIKPNLISVNMKNILSKNFKKNNIKIKKINGKKKKKVNNFIYFDGNFFGILIISLFIIGFYIRYIIIN